MRAVLKTAEEVAGGKAFAGDPTDKHGYSLKVQQPMYLDFVAQRGLHRAGLASEVAAQRSRGRQARAQ